jgi:hypothetical protein
LWDGVLDHAVDLDPGQVRLLEDAARTCDLIDGLVDALKDAPKTVKGSMGQLVANPMIQEVRQHRATLNTLVRSLDLSKAQTTAAIEAAVQARMAQERDRTEAQERWRARRGQ